MKLKRCAAVLYTCLCIAIMSGCSPGRHSLRDEEALRAVKTVTILPAVFHVENEKIDREFMEAAQLAGIEAEPLSEELRPKIEKELLKQLQKRMPVAIDSTVDLSYYLEMPVSCDSTMWTPKWKTNPDSLSVDAFIFLEISMITRTRVSSRCTVYAKNAVVPLLSVMFVPKHKKEHFDPTNLPGPIYEAIKQGVKKLAAKWPEKSE